MRWFIEVSTVGDGDADTQYCVEAKQWQAALQQARKLRGEAGPLSAFSIELLDNGYRAVDKKQNLKYVVKKAPNDAPLDDGKNGVVSPVAQERASSAPAAEPARLTVSQPPVSQKASGPPPKPRLESSRPAASATSEPPAKQSAVSSSKAPPKKVAEVLATAPAKAANSSAPEVGSGAPAVQVPVASDDRPRSEPEPASGAAVELPEFEVVRERSEEPSAETPIAYRELAFAVKPDTSKEAVQSLLLARYASIAKELQERPKGKFVQLAVFDHAFAKKPLRAPLATLTWKDWRGEPVLSFAGFEGGSLRPTAPDDPEVEVGSLRPISVIPVDETTGSVPPPPKETFDPGTAELLSAGDLRAPPAPNLTLAPAEAAPAKEADVSEKVSPPAAGVPVESGTAKRDSSPGEAIQERRSSRPRMDRLQSSDDLIGHLFEKMHELHFMADVVAGSEFVLSAVKEMLRSSFVLVHVFDINTKNFVVVRQHGGSEKVLMFQTPDRDVHLRRVMRAPRSVRLSGVSPENGDGRWKAAAVLPDHLLCGPVKQGGRYLGLVELGKPVGAAPFTEADANALDYVCEQFAEFLANRPIVLDAEVILK